MKLKKNLFYKLFQKKLIEITTFEAKLDIIKK